MSATAIITGLVHEAIRIARGTDKPLDLSASKIADAIADRVKEKIAEVIHAELKHAYAILGLTLATQDLAEVASRVLRSMREAEGGGGLPNILDGAQVQIVDEITDEDRASEKAGFEALKPLKPDGER